MATALRLTNQCDHARTGKPLYRVATSRSTSAYLATVTPPGVDILSAAPEGLFDLPAHELTSILKGPTLIHFKVDNDPALFVAVLLHGNETSGWYAVSNWLKMQPLRRNLILFIGNVHAAAARQRSLSPQPDYNRIWRDCDLPEGNIARQVMAYLSQQNLLLAVDLHNNTGRNPHYSVITDQRSETLRLAELFSDKAVYVEEPDTVLSRAVSDLCPSVAVELGPIEDPVSDERALTLVSQLTELEGLPTEPTGTLSTYQAIARVHIQPDTSFDFADHHRAETDLTLTAGIEGVNFHELSPGTTFGHLNNPLELGLYALSPTHEDVTNEFFSVEGGELQLARPVIPAMYTTDPAVVRQDCLCYFMERL